MTPRSRRTIGLALALLVLPGCLQRRIHITSEPAGALVVVNDVEIGHTPCEMDFTFYGTYDVLLRKDGFEPLRSARTANAPWYEYPGFDLVATALPTTIETNLDWHFDLEPALETTMDRATFETELLERARDLRAESGSPADGTSTEGADDPDSADESDPTADEPGG